MAAGERCNACIWAAPPAWNRQESCSECDGDGCAKCDPENHCSHCGTAFTNWCSFCVTAYPRRPAPTPAPHKHDWFLRRVCAICGCIEEQK